MVETEEVQLVRDLKNIQSRDKAFSKLLDLYQERLYWHIRKIVHTHENANDVLQNTCIRIYRGIESFKEDSKLHTWMYRIAYNESIRLLEKEKKLNLSDADGGHIESIKQDPYFDGDALQIKLNKIISSLTEKQQRVFQMKYFDDLSFKEISEILDVSENTLKSAYYSAVKIVEEKIVAE